MYLSRSNAIHLLAFGFLSASYSLMPYEGRDKRRQRVSYFRPDVALILRLSSLLPLPRGRHAPLSLMSGFSPRRSVPAQRKGLFATCHGKLLLIFSVFFHFL